MLVYLYGNLHGLSVPAFGVRNTLSVVKAVIYGRLIIFRLLLQIKGFSADSHSAEKHNNIIDTNNEVNADGFADVSSVNSIF